MGGLRRGVDVAMTDDPSGRERLCGRVGFENH